MEADGEEEVFDLQVDRTENFIANGVVSHNTWWNADDWAGRIQEAMKDGGDKFEIIRYRRSTNRVTSTSSKTTASWRSRQYTRAADARMTRPHNTAVHPARYTTEAMLRIKNNPHPGGQKRVWDALAPAEPHTRRG